MSKYNKDPNKKYRNDWDNLKVGDYIFSDCNGPCSGGMSYGIGELVTKITDKNIHSKDSEGKSTWNKKTKYHVGPPYAYFLGAFQSN
jgi:hypothetical protein